MFLKCSKRIKNGKEHRSWAIVESKRLSDGRCIQRQVLYLGEINDSQRQAWQKSVEVFEAGKQPVQMAIFPEDRLPENSAIPTIQIKLHEMRLENPRQWGACWLAHRLWQELGLDQFWREKLPSSREGTEWDKVLALLVIYRLIDPGSEWRLHRQWLENHAIHDLLGDSFRLITDDTLYRCHDKILAHKEAVLSFLQERWKSLFNAKFDVLLYDLTSTYFECDVPEKEGLRRFGYSRDKRSDCVQVVIALIVTPEGLPIGYEVLSGNTTDKSTLAGMLEKVEKQYGKINRTWLMDRGIPTEEVLEKMRNSNPAVRYIVGTPKGRLSKMEADLAELPWQKAREGVAVKLYQEEDEFFILARSEQRVLKERSMRRRRLKKLWNRLKELQQQKPSYELLLQKIGAAKSDAGRVASLVQIDLPEPPKTSETRKEPSVFTFSLKRNALKKARQREGNYILRSNLAEADPAAIWQQYILLTQIEEAFKNLKGDLGLRPIYHQRDDRIEAHIFIAFLAYCLQVTLRQKLKAHASGLTPRAVFEKMATIQMLDVHLPTTDDRELVLSRFTQPGNEIKLLLDTLKIRLPQQPPPKITTKTNLAA